MSKKSISFIGCGNIATAIMSGIISKGYIKPAQIYGYDISQDRINKVAEIGVNAIDSIDKATKCDFVFLTVKPQIIMEVLPLLKDKINGCIVSVVAGLNIDKITACVGDVPVIRVMPNTPIMVGAGAAGICKNAFVSQSDFDFVQGIFNSCGICRPVTENLMDAVTALSGSGPAYVFRFVKALCEQAQELGLNREDSLSLACATLRGGADMLENSGMSACELIKMVSSPNGTTVAGLSKLDEYDFDNAVKSCVNAAAERSKELSK